MLSFIIIRQKKGKQGKFVAIQVEWKIDERSLAYLKRNKTYLRFAMIAALFFGTANTE